MLSLFYYSYVIFIKNKKMDEKRNVQLYELPQQVQGTINKILSYFYKWRPDYYIHLNISVYGDSKRYRVYFKVIDENGKVLCNPNSEYFSEICNTNLGWEFNNYNQSAENYIDYNIKSKIKYTKNHIYAAVKRAEKVKYHKNEGIVLRRFDQKNRPLLEALKNLAKKYFGDVYKGIDYDIFTAYSTGLGEFPIFKFATSPGILRSKSESIIYIHWYELLHYYLKDKMNSQEMMVMNILEEKIYK